MHLYLVRHACPREKTGDAPLGDEGIKQAELLGKLFATLNLRPESLRILSSTARRARETATLVCQGMGLPDEVAIFPEPIDYQPGNDLRDRLMKRLIRITAEEGPSEVAVIGHYDYLPQSLAWLLKDDILRFPVEYGATVCLTCNPTFEQGAGVLEWLVVPALLRCLLEGVSTQGRAPSP
jgi:phosphohistidine phosphatase SixA